MATHVPDWSELLTDAVNTPGLILQAYAAFHTYSTGNQLLALWQCRARGLTPGPIATYPGWQAKGRQVRKGEKALTLLMPITVKDKRPEIVGTDDEGKTFTTFVYKPHWFVLAQTEGDELPPVVIPVFDAERALAALGIERVTFESLNGNSQGYASKQQIAINPLAELPHKTLFHEAAHVVLGHTAETDCVGDETTPRSLREVEAECVALICCESLDLPGVEYCRGYIQHWFAGDVIPDKSAQKIFHAADQILKAGQAATQHQVMTNLPVEPATEPPASHRTDPVSEAPASSPAAPEPATEARPLNSYELRQQRRQERYEGLARKAKRESEAAFQAADRISSFIPLGQPILVGHHSERRHRRDLDRIHKKMGQGIEADKKSEYYSRRADSVGTAGISSDDPDAIPKLKEKLAQLEEAHAAMKAANKQQPGAYPAYAQQNSNANLRRVRERIAQLEKAATKQTAVIELPGLTIRHDVDENRVMLFFDAIPAAAIRTLCKKQGFKWSPTRNAWVRHLSNAAIYAAEIVSKALAEDQPSAEGRGEQGKD
jgi:hypothetical protein